MIKRAEPTNDRHLITMPFKELGIKEPNLDRYSSDRSVVYDGDRSIEYKDDGFGPFQSGHETEYQLPGNGVRLPSHNEEMSIIRFEDGELSPIGSKRHIDRLDSSKIESEDLSFH